MSAIARSNGLLPFGTAIVAFGLQEIVYLSAGVAPPPGPPWNSSSSLWAFATGVVLAGAGLCLLLRAKIALAASVLSAAILLRSAIVYIPGILTNVRDPRNWTSGFELLAMCGASFSLVAMMDGGARDRSPMANRVGKFGPILFGGSLLVFGAQHFLYAAYIATLIPAWIPGRLFCAYLVGVLFFGAALAILSRRLSRLAARLLGIMFLSWVAIVHFPRVVSTPHDGREWTSLFVALAMAGGSLIIDDAEPGTVAALRETATVGDGVRPDSQSMQTESNSQNTV